ncbi:MAG: hypothetical protein QXO51_03670 [Halobacteria archaeon]
MRPGALLAAALLVSGCVIPDFSPAEAVSEGNLKARAMEGVRSVRSLNFTTEMTVTLPSSGPDASPLRFTTTLRGTLDNETGSAIFHSKSQGPQTTQETSEAVVGGFNYTRDTSGAWLKERVSPEEGKRQVSQVDPMNYTAQLFSISDLTWQRLESSGGRSLHIVKVAPDRGKVLDLLGPSFLSQGVLETAEATYRLEASTLYPESGDLLLRLRFPDQGPSPGGTFEMRMRGNYSGHNRVPPRVLPKEAEGAPTASECAAKGCFVAAANLCKAATVTVSESFGTMRYSSNDCALTKSVVAPAPGERPELKTLLQGASMTCAYERGKFDRTWVDSLLAGVEFCEGGLKDLIADLVVFA